MVNVFLHGGHATRKHIAMIVQMRVLFVVNIFKYILGISTLFEMSYSLYLNPIINKSFGVHYITNSNAVIRRTSGMAVVTQTTQPNLVVVNRCLCVVT